MARFCRVRRLLSLIFEENKTFGKIAIFVLQAFCTETVSMAENQGAFTSKITRSASLVGTKFESQLDAPASELFSALRIDF